MEISLRCVSGIGGIGSIQILLPLLIRFVAFSKSHSWNKSVQHSSIHSRLPMYIAGTSLASYSQLSQTNDNDDIVIGFLAEYSEMRVTLGGLPLAVESVNKNPKLLPDRRLSFKAFDIGQKNGSHRVQSLKFMTQMRDENVAAFIGPDDSCTSEALLASAWNLPMMSFKCPDSAVSNKEIFPTFARTLAPASKVSKSVISLLHAFNWNKFAIIVGARPVWGSEVAKAIQDLAELEDFTITHFKEISDYVPINTTLIKMQNIVDETYPTTRIYVFIGEHIAMVDFVRCLQNRHLLASGNYLIISVDDEIYDSNRQLNIMERNYLDPYLRRDSRRRLDKNSFRSVLKISMSHPQNPNIRAICSKIKQYARKYPFLVPYHERVFDNISVPVYGIHLYDTVMIYARAITEMLSNGENIRDGRLVMSHIFNRSYHSINGFDVHIDSNGDAEGNYTVITLQNEAGNLYGSLTKMSMLPVGFFVFNKSSSLPEFRYIRHDRPIQWIKGRPPLAEPICGFSGDLCRPRKMDWRFIASGSFTGFFLLVAGTFIIKHYRYEQILAGLLWKVDIKDVTIIPIDNNIQYNNLKNKHFFHTCRQSFLNGVDATKRAYTSIGLYRGNIVAMKKIYKKSVDITRSIRKELKQMREVRHENIINFIGVSIDHGSVIIFTTYCARGSLEDVLANEDVRLDHMFISSLVSDILKGMIYLHDSEIISHGNLRSSNCLIDSRWVCQICDFGLNEFKAGQDEPNKREKELKRALWTAPELLRDAISLPRGTQKGDVYSFGIVLYEMIGRKGPWGGINYDNKEIIELVTNSKISRHGIFRPPLSQLDIPDYIRQCLRSCWEEDPELRPDIRLVRIKLKELQAGLSSNIFDNMLAIMEKYAYNLEGLVLKRTNLLYEEKKKTDLLLNQMLPRSVAESLKRHEPVEPECFDCVTIFFSDIVGFTELCATSTPVEVIEMLNDLYTCCDSAIPNYDVYKVETIGDAYMVASGLPIRNGNRHAGEIASLALHLIEHVSKLQIRHRPEESIELRIGIHSGPCAAGVVGMKMPRYCLFGDTVNTASRLESTGEPMKIHISEMTYQLLEQVGGYRCVARGLTTIKGKGEMPTYWLMGRILEMVSEQRPMAPDLICNTEVETLSSGNHHSASSRATSTLSNHRNQYVSNQRFNNFQFRNQFLPSTTTTTTTAHRMKTTYCRCGTKCIYNRRSDDNVIFERSKIQNDTTEHTTTTNTNANAIYHNSPNSRRNALCICALNTSTGQINSVRGPQSAPHISFRM